MYLILAVLLFATPVYAQELPEVFILSGQSNMYGFPSSATLPGELATLPTNAEVWVWDFRVAQFKHLTIFYDATTQGPDVSFIHTVCAAYPERQFIFIKYAVPGSGLPAWMPEWSAEYASVTNNVQLGPLYSKMLTAVRIAIGKRTVNYRALIWLQGERDCCYHAASIWYAANFRKIISRLRKDLATPDLKVILGVVNPTEPTEDSARISQAQIDVAQIPYCRAVTLEGATKLSNGHYDENGLKVIGRRMALKYINSR